MNTVKSSLIYIICTVILLPMFTTIINSDMGSVYGQEHRQNHGPVYVPAVVDGDFSEWDLSYDFFSFMKDANTKDEVLSKLYVRYDEFTQMLYILVLSEGSPLNTTNIPQLQFVEPGALVSQINTISLSPAGMSGGIHTDFKWIESNGNEAKGWEASMPLAQGEYDIFNVISQNIDDKFSAIVDENVKLWIHYEVD